MQRRFNFEFEEHSEEKNLNHSSAIVMNKAKLFEEKPRCRKTSRHSPFITCCVQSIIHLTWQVNLRQLEERLNMIQEECNRDSDETDDERSATIDERSEK